MQKCNCKNCSTGCECNSHVIVNNPVNFKNNK